MGRVQSSGLSMVCEFGVFVYFCAIMLLHYSYANCAFLPKSGAVFQFLFILSSSFAIYTAWKIQGVLCALINASTLPVPSVPSVSKYYHFFGQKHESKLLCLVFWYYGSWRFFNRFLRCLSEFRAVLRYLEPLSHCALKSILRSHKCMVPVYRTGEFPMLRICLPHKRIKNEFSGVYGYVVMVIYHFTVNKKVGFPPGEGVYPFVQPQTNRAGGFDCLVGRPL